VPVKSNYGKKCFHTTTLKNHIFALSKHCASITQLYFTGLDETK